jgi:hypothetical protein
MCRLQSLSLSTVHRSSQFKRQLATAGSIQDPSEPSIHFRSQPSAKCCAAASWRFRRRVADDRRFSLPRTPLYEMELWIRSSLLMQLKSDFFSNCFECSCRLKWGLMTSFHEAPLHPFQKWTQRSSAVLAANNVNYWTFANVGSDTPTTVTHRPTTIEGMPHLSPAPLSSRVKHLYWQCKKLLFQQ